MFNVTCLNCLTFSTGKNEYLPARCYTSQFPFISLLIILGKIKIIQTNILSL